MTRALFPGGDSLYGTPGAVWGSSARDRASTRNRAVARTSRGGLVLVLAPGKGGVSLDAPGRGHMHFDSRSGAVWGHSAVQVTLAILHGRGERVEERLLLVDSKGKPSLERKPSTRTLHPPPQNLNPKLQILDPEPQNLKAKL